MLKHQVCTYVCIVEKEINKYQQNKQTIYLEREEAPKAHTQNNELAQEAIIVEARGRKYTTSREANDPCHHYASVKEAIHIMIHEWRESPMQWFCPHIQLDT